jgi:putative sporulation protein YtaF
VLSLLVIAIAVSLDSFGIGVAYGVRRIRVPLRSLIMITLCTALTLLLAMVAGEAVVAVLSPGLTEALGGIMLIGIGGFAVLNQLRSQQRSAPSPDRSEPKEPSPQTSLPQQYLHKIEAIPEILRSPAAADFDHSKSISLDEALILGLAVSLDSFVAGIGIRLLGYSPWSIILTMALMSSAFIYLGIRAGIWLSGHRWTKQLPYFPGTLLIIIGLERLI